MTAGAAMLGVLTGPDGQRPPDGDAVLARLAAATTAAGVPLAGALQQDDRTAEGRRTGMRLHLLGPAGGEVTISQRLGAAAAGCRLDPGALEDAVARVLAALPQARLVLLAKFGGQEAAGRGFRPVIAEALGRGLPVLTTVAPDAAPAFADFAAGLAREVPADRAEAWCRAAVGLPVEIDARGLRCPLPVLRLRRVLAVLPPGAEVCLAATDGAAVLDVPHFCAEAGHDFLGATPAPDGAQTYRVRRGDRPAES